MVAASTRTSPTSAAPRSTWPTSGAARTTSPSWPPTSRATVSPSPTRPKTSGTRSITWTTETTRSRRPFRTPSAVAAAPAASGRRSNAHPAPHGGGALPAGRAPSGLALNPPSEARLGTRLELGRRPLLRLRPSLLLLQRDRPRVARRVGDEPGGDRPRVRRVAAVGAQVPVGACWWTGSAAAGCGSGCASSCWAWYSAVLAGADPVRHAGAARGAAAAVRHAVGHAGHRDRRLYDRDHPRARAGRGQLGPDRLRTAGRASSAAHCWCGSRDARDGGPRFWRAPSCSAAWRWRR